MNSPTTAVGRIPAALQAVFIASNSELEVPDTPPPEADMVFQNDGSTNQEQADARTNRLLEDSKAKLEKLAQTLSSGCRVTDVASQCTLSNKPCASPARSPIRSDSEVSPQCYLNSMIRERGYSTNTYKTLETGYYNKPSPLQLASYSQQMIEIVKSGDVKKLTNRLQQGLSPNPCNRYGESLVHMAARRGDVAVLRAFVDAGCSLQVSDDYGRTPLHDACWTAAPAFDVLDILLRDDARLLYFMDGRGSLPLAYVRKENWNDYKMFFEATKDLYFPVRPTEQGPPKMSRIEPNTKPLADPVGAVSVKRACTVASAQDEEVVNDLQRAPKDIEETTYQGFDSDTEISEHCLDHSEYSTTDCGGCYESDDGDESYHFEQVCVTFKNVAMDETVKLVAPKSFKPTYKSKQDDIIFL